MPSQLPNHRILIIDDHRAIHEDFRKILGGHAEAAGGLEDMEDALFGAGPAKARMPAFELDSAYQGREGLEKIEQSLREGRPYALAFVDVRMPPGWDGVETTAEIWRRYPELQVVICTAYSDYSWEQMVERLGFSDRLVILKKPFDTIEVIQLAVSLTEKWRLYEETKRQLTELEQRVNERTASLTAANSELNAVNRQLELATEQAQKLAHTALMANRAKGEFLASMSHEIRTPMTAILGMAHLLLETSLTPEQREFAETVQTSTEALLGIIDDILDFSKIEAGRLTFEQVEFDLVQVVEEAIGLLVDRAQRKKIDLGGSVDARVPARLVGDPMRLRQVLVNLISNAVKFTDRGEVAVDVTLVSEAEGDVTFRAAVRDTGIGISGPIRQFLFQPFNQAEVSTARRFGGTGLGLAISRKLVEMMRGEIGVESSPGVGSTFWFTAKLPRAEATDAEGLEAGAGVGRVLLAVGSALHRESVRRLLIRAGVPCEAVGTEEDAVAAVERTGTGPGGFEVVIDEAALSAVRQRITAPGLRWVQLAPLGSRATAGPGAAVLSRPVKVRQLQAVLSSVEGGAKSVVPDGGVVEAGTETGSGLAGLRVLLAEDNRVNQKVALLQLQKLGCDVTTVTNGISAIEEWNAGKCSVILMDCQMPDMDGYEATRRIRAMETKLGRAPVRIIAMTANAMQGDRERCLKSGMDDYVSKPFRRAELVRALEKALAPAET